MFANLPQLQYLSTSLSVAPSPRQLPSRHLTALPHSGSEYSFAKNSLANFSTQQKNLCYYAGLILLQKFFLLLGSRAP